jgi:hypothetical protein
MAESFFSSLKNERVHRTVHATKAQVRRDVIANIEGFYNSRGVIPASITTCQTKSTTLTTSQPWQRRKL